MTRNLRFWTYAYDSPVKITLRPGQELEHYTVESHDEGWSSDETTWRHAGDRVERFWRTDGVDCDGRLTRTGADECPEADLHAGFDPQAAGYTDMPVKLPRWSDPDVSVYDQYARAAGY